MEGERYAYLDNLRASLTALVICHHANAAYGSPGGWYYIVHERGGVLTEILTTMFAGVTQAFFMSSFFLISAFFTAPGYDRKGPWRYTKRRALRLGVPFLVYFYVLSVVLSYIIHCFEGHSDLGFFAYFASRFLRHTEPGPLWFAFALMVFESVYIAYRLIADRLGRAKRSYPLPTDRQVLLFLIAIGVFTFLFRQWQPLTVSFFHMRLAFFPMYVCMFVFGLMAYRSGWFKDLSAQQANRWFRVSLVAIAIAPLVMILNAALGYDAYKFWEGFTWQCYAYAAWEPFLCIGINMKLIVLYRERFDWSNAFTQRMAKSAFTAYIFHAFFIVVATYLFTFFSIGRVPEILLMWPITVIPCFLFADAFRRLPLARKIL